MAFPILVEQFWINHLKAQFFYRSPRKDEVDLVMENNQMVLPVEIKMRENITIRDASALFAFLSRFDSRTGLMITLDREGILKRNHHQVQLIPYWKYHSILNFVKTQLNFSF